jgi:hypothetical protein
MIPNLERVKLGTTTEAITAFSGLSLFLQVAKALGLEKKLNQLALKARARGYAVAESVFSLMGLLQSGGVALDDIDVLRRDEGLQRLVSGIPAANTLGEFLRRFENRTLWALGRIVLNAAVMVIRSLKLKEVTLDVDAFTVESQKANAAWNYNGELGFTPIMVSCGELKMPMTGLWRGGNASPASHITGLLERVMERLSGTKLNVRSDSAGYQVGMVKLCEQKKASFTVTARKTKAVMEVIGAIPTENWQPYKGSAYPDRKQEVAETVHVMKGEKEEDYTEAHRLIVVRWVKEGMELLKEYEYHAVYAERDGKAEEVLTWHRKRQDESENVNKEMVVGFGLEKLPCGEMKANAAYFQIGMLAAIVATALKALTLPESWHSFTMKTLRFRLIHMAGVVVRHARQVWLKIPQGHAFQEIFEAAWWRIKGLTSEWASMSTA